MNSRYHYLLAIATLGIILCLPHSTLAQKAFKEGETLQYSLYYNWGILWVKAGSATMSISRANYNGVPAYRTRLLMRGTKEADGYFVLRDTLTSFTSLSSIQPLYYCKEDLEGSKHRRREVWYNYAGGKCYVNQAYTKADNSVKKQNEVYTQQAYDMLSIMLNARSWNPSSWHKGKKINFIMTDGNGCEKQTLIYRGKTRIKMRNTTTVYRCLQLSFVEYNDEREKEVVTFYVTDDDNHIPVRLDLFLRIGTAKAYLVSSRGLLNPSTAKIK